MLKTASKKKVIEKNQIHDTDTGSSAVQIAIISKQIEQLAAHLKKYRKDNHSRRGLLKMVAKRKSLLEYLSKGDTKQLSTLQKKFGIKK
ncbi:MAG: 30S ribosomal protein S15 [bacterium]|nr:30S ribosomal protein S15 [bacterium]